MNKNRIIKKEKPQSEAMTSPEKLVILFTIVNRQKTELFVDYITGFDVNFQTVFNARGTASKETLSSLGIPDSEKSLIMSVIKESKAKEALEFLEEKFKTVKNGRGIACTVPMTSTIGVYIYKFLMNNRSDIE